MVRKAPKSDKKPNSAPTPDIPGVPPTRDKPPSDPSPNVPAVPETPAVPVPSVGAEDADAEKALTPEAVPLVTVAPPDGTFDNTAIVHAAQVLQRRAESVDPVAPAVDISDGKPPTTEPPVADFGFPCDASVMTLLQYRAAAIVARLHPGSFSTTDLSGHLLSREEAEVECVTDESIVVGFDNGLGSLFRPLARSLLDHAVPMNPPVGNAVFGSSGDTGVLTIGADSSSPLAKRVSKSTCSEAQRLVGNTNGAVKVARLSYCNLFSGCRLGVVDAHDTEADRLANRIVPKSRRTCSRRTIAGIRRNVRSRVAFFTLTPLVGGGVTERDRYDANMPAFARAPPPVALMRPDIPSSEIFLSIEPCARLGSLGALHDLFRSISSCDIEVYFEAAQRVVTSTKAVGMKGGVGEGLLASSPFSSDGFRSLVKAIYMGANVELLYPTVLTARSSANWTGYMIRCLDCCAHLPFQILPAQQNAVADNIAQNYPYARCANWAAFLALPVNVSAVRQNFAAALEAYVNRCLNWLVAVPLAAHELDPLRVGARTIQSIPNLDAIFMNAQGNAQLSRGPVFDTNDLAGIRGLIGEVLNLDFQSVVSTGFMAVEPLPRNALGARDLIRDRSFEPGALAVVLTHASYMRSMIADPFHVSASVAAFVMPRVNSPGLLTLALDGVANTREPIAPDGEYSGKSPMTLIRGDGGVSDWWFNGDTHDSGIRAQPLHDFKTVVRAREAHDFMQSVQNAALYWNMLLRGACMAAPQVYTQELLHKLVSRVLNLYYGSGTDTFTAGVRESGGYSELAVAQLGDIIDSSYLHIVVDSVFAGRAVAEGIASRPCGYQRMRLFMAANASMTEFVSLETRGLYVGPPTDIPVYASYPLYPSPFSPAPIQFLVFPTAGRVPFPVSPSEIETLIDSGVELQAVPTLDLLCASVCNSRGIRRMSSGLVAKRYVIDAFVSVSKVIPFSGHLTSTSGNITDIKQAVAPIVLADAKSTDFTIVSANLTGTITGDASSLSVKPRANAAEIVEDDFQGRVVLGANRQAVAQCTMGATIFQVGDPLFSRHSVMPFQPCIASRMVPFAFARCRLYDVTRRLVLSRFDSEILDLVFYYGTERAIRLESYGEYKP